MNQSITMETVNEKLEVGQEVKNYKVLCDLLEVEKKKCKKSRDYHLLEINRYANVEKIKGTQRFIVNKIFDEVQPKVDKRKSDNPDNKRNGRFDYELTEILLLDLFASSYNEVSYYTVGKLLEGIHAVNGNYSISRHNQKALAKITEVKLKIINEFFAKTHNSLKNFIERGLANLEKRFLITTEKVFMVKQLGDFSARPATRKESQYLMKVHRQVLIGLGFTKESQIYASGFDKKFYFEVEKKLKEDESNKIVECYKAFRIVLNYDEIKNVCNEIEDLILNNDERITKHIEMSESIEKRISESAFSRHKKAKTEYGFSVDKDRIEYIRVQDEYLEGFDKIKGIVISPFPDDIKVKMKK
ncbi:hypothetical protein [Jeotgalibacillus haloalkalitolerans]|uniref:Initiator Rep protein domain-containing protein n=1 Tax=Jeotgalibacillus haloalkalitolerans TaxID=3104292 RepID=A0ABU5KS51_9BACL|nr:hypothetical protein [Jeotgalibacillus sp. HH7-29]MDZ5713550.1 hypothetical protein [Jeotgalibacillus sp. HH7-29]